MIYNRQTSETTGKERKSIFKSESKARQSKRFQKRVSCQKT